MSDLTLCCYCSHQSLLFRAKNEGLIVTTRRERGWITAYAHPSDVTIPVEGFPEDSVESHQYWRASYMVLTDHCVC